MMVTLTVDPKLFGSPVEAYRYVREKRAIAELVRALKKAGHLRSNRYFYVVEFHKNGWAHFHLLLEAEFIPFKVLCQLWGRNRPKSAPAWGHKYEESLAGVEPEFGTCRISVGKFSGGAHHAACYATKYMVKYPEHGFPQWTFDEMNAGRRIRLYQTSHGLLPGKPSSKNKCANAEEESGVAEHSADCFCDACRAGEHHPTKKEQRTIEDRLADCGTRAAVLEVTEVKDETGKVVRSSRRFWRMLEITFAQACVVLDFQEVGKRWVQLKEGDWFRLVATRGHTPSVIGGGINAADVARFAEFDQWNASGGVI
ncbi:rolling circle replication-associated protein [Anatilimnocola aggregata]|nr:hypothetical protein [Anatilimnocola aggregata]